MQTETTTPLSRDISLEARSMMRVPKLCWSAILGGTLAAIGIHILFTALGMGAGLAQFAPSADADTLKDFSMGSALVWTFCALVALAFGGFVAGRFSGSHLSGFVHGVLVWCAALVLTLVMLSVGTGMVMGGAVKALAGGMQTTAQAVAGPAGDMAKEATTRVTDQLNSFIKEATDQAPTNSAPSSITAAHREIGFALTQLFASGNQTNSTAQRGSAIAALSQHTGISENEAAKAVDSWISSERKLKAELTRLQNAAEQKAKEAADVAAKNLSRAALWTFFGLLVGLMVTAFAGRCGATYALKWAGFDESHVITETTPPRPR